MRISLAWRKVTSEICTPVMFVTFCPVLFVFFCMGFLELAAYNFLSCFTQSLTPWGQLFITFLPIVNCIKQEKKVFLKKWSCFVIFFSQCTVQLNWKEIKGKNKNQNIIWKYTVLYSFSCEALFSIGTKQQQTYANFVPYCQHYSKRSKFVNICCDLISSHTKC